MTLKLIPPPPPDPPPPDEDVSIPRATIDKLYRRIDALEKRAKKAEVDVSNWVESWTWLVSEVGELMHRAKQRSKGKRVISILEIWNLLNRADKREADDR